MLNFDSMDIPDEVKKIADQHSETVKTFKAGAHEADSTPEVQNLAKVSKGLAEQTKGGVEETGKSEPDLAVVQNQKPAAEPSINVG